MKIGYNITGRGGERTRFHLMRNKKFLCGTKTNKVNLIVADGRPTDVECKKCWNKFANEEM